jgi:hypothetical protein
MVRVAYHGGKQKSGARNCQSLKSETKRRTSKKGRVRVAKMMLFLGAVASNPFGIKTLKEIEKQFENDYHKN